MSAPSERQRFRWTILALISVSHIVGGLGQYAINTLAPFYQQDLQLSRAQIGLFFTAFYLGMAGLSFLAGSMADRLGVRSTTLIGHLFLGLCTIMASLAFSFGWAFVAFFFAGLGYSFLNPASTKGVMAWFQRDERATAMGIKQTGVPAGGVVTAMLAPPLVLFFGWRGALAILGVINLIYGFFFWFFWRDPIGDSSKPELAYFSSRRPKVLPAFKNLLCVSFGTAVLLVGQMSLLTYLPLYLKESMGYSAYWASQTLAFTQVGAMGGRAGWGMVSDRLFRSRRKGVLALIGFLSVLFTLALGMMPSATSVFILTPLIFLAGICLVGYQGVSYALIGEIAGEASTGAALGMVITVNSVGVIIGTPLFGYLVDQTGSYSIAWLSLAGIIFLGMLALIVYLREPEPTEEQVG